MRLPLAWGAGIACVALACGTLQGSDTDVPADAEVAAVADASAETASDGGLVEDPRVALYRATVLGDAPIGYWPFDDPPGSTTARALAGPVGVAQIAPVAGEPGIFGAGSRAFRFDGTTNTQIVVADASFAFPGDGQAVSLECWYRPTDAPDGSFRHLFAWYVQPSGLGVYEEQGAGISFERIVAGGTSGKKNSVNIGAPERAKWHHVVAVSSPPSPVAIFVDGVPTTQVGLPIDFHVDGAGPLRIGGRLGVPSIRGSMAEVAFYDKALTAAQVAAHRARGLAP
jgi:hypothetical protein